MNLFNFSFDHPVSFLLAFIPALFNLALLFHILVFLPRTHFTNIFALLTFAAFFWQIDESLHRIIVGAQAADVWDCILCTAWLFIGPLCLHFSMLYAHVIRSHSSRLYVSLLYVPSFVFLAIYQMQTLNSPWCPSRPPMWENLCWNYAAFTDLNSKKICVPLLFSSFMVPPNCCVRRDIS